MSLPAHRRLLIPVFLAALLLVAWAHASAQGQETGFVQMVINDQTRMPYFESVFGDREEPFLNFNTLMEAVELPIAYDPAPRSASGFLADGTTRFVLSLDRLTAEVGERSLPLAAADFRVVNNVLYLHYGALGRLLPLDVKWLPVGFEVRITTHYRLPSQERRLRDLQHQALRQQQSAAFSAADLERDVPWFDPGMLELDASTLGGKDQPNQNSLTLRGVQRFLKGDLEYSLSQHYLGSENQGGEVDYLRLRYYDPLHTWEATLGDTYLSFSPLILDAASFRGASFYTGGQRFRFGRTTLIGTAAPGSEVDLYRLGVLVDFTRADAQGFYRFDNVPLTVDTTLFEIHIYTPQGRHLIEFREVSSQEQMLAQGDVASQGGGGYGQDPGNAFHLSGGEVRYGLLSSLTLGAYAIRLEDYAVESTLLPPQETGGLFLLWRPLGWLVLQGEQARDSLQAGLARRWDAFFGLMVMSLELEHRAYGGTFAPPARTRATFFSVPDQVDTSNQAELRTRVLATNLDLRVRRSDFGETRQLDENELRMDRRLTRALTLTLTLNRDRFTEALQPEGGQDRQEMLAGYRLGTLSRLELSYQHSQVLRSGPAELWQGVWLKNYEFGSPWAYRVSYVSSSTDPDYGQAALGYLFANNLRINGQVDSKGRWLLQVNYSVPFRVGGQGLEALPPNTFGRAGLEGTVFLDQNGDGQRGPNEPGVPNVNVLAPGVTAVDTGPRGTYRAWGLPADVPSAVEVNLLTADALYVPSRRRYPLAARPGELVHLDIPLVPAGGLEGTLHDAGKSQISPAFGLELVLAHGEGGQEEARTAVEWDGSFVFENIPPGAYRLAADPAQLEKMGLRLVPASHQVVMPAGQDPAWLSAIDFRLEQAAAPRADP